jgi:hypothetical protein
MTVDEIDALLDRTHDEAVAAGNLDREPGLISLSADTYIRLGDDLKTACPIQAQGIHYRDVRVVVRIRNEDGVFNRAEARVREPQLTAFRAPMSKADWLARP